MMGLFGVSSSAHSVRRLSLPLFQPGFDGFPIPSRTFRDDAGAADADADADKDDADEDMA